jgi:hypothetical protein
MLRLTYIEFAHAKAMQQLQNAHKNISEKEQSCAEITVYPKLNLRPVSKYHVAFRSIRFPRGRLNSSLASAGTDSCSKQPTVQGAGFGTDLFIVDVVAQTLVALPAFRCCAMRRGREMLPAILYVLAIARPRTWAIVPPTTL